VIQIPLRRALGRDRSGSQTYLASPRLLRTLG
jgi:hypothetical protein